MSWVPQRPSEIWALDWRWLDLSCLRYIRVMGCICLTSVMVQSRKWVNGSGWEWGSFSLSQQVFFFFFFFNGHSPAVVQAEGRGSIVPPRPQKLLTKKFLLTYWGKRVKGKKGGNRAEKKENRKKEGIKFKTEGDRRGLFFFLFFFFFFFHWLFKTTEICFGSTKMGIFYREKAFHAGKKIRKNDFAPLWKIFLFIHVCPCSQPKFKY